MIMTSIQSIYVVFWILALARAERPSNVGEPSNETDIARPYEAAVNGRGRWARSAARQTNAISHLGIHAAPLLQQPVQLQPASLVDLTMSEQERKKRRSAMSYLYNNEQNTAEPQSQEAQLEEGKKKLPRPGGKGDDDGERVLSEFETDDRYSGTYTFPTPGNKAKGPYAIDVDLVARTWNSEETGLRAAEILVKRGADSVKIEGSHCDHDNPNHITIADASFGFVFDGMVGPDKRIKGEVFEGKFVDNVGGECDVLQDAREEGEFSLSPAGEIQEDAANEDEIAYVWSDEGVRWLKSVSEESAEANTRLTASQVKQIPTLKDYAQHYVMAYKWTEKGAAWAGPDSETPGGKFLRDDPTPGSYVTVPQMSKIPNLQDAEAEQYLEKVEADLRSIQSGEMEHEQDSTLNESSLAVKKLHRGQRELQDAENRLGAVNGKGTDIALESMTRSAKYIKQAAEEVQYHKGLHAPRMRDFGECKNKDIDNSFHSIMRDAKALGEWGLCWDSRPDTGEVNVYFPGNPDMAADTQAPCNRMGVELEAHSETMNVEAGTISVTHGPLGMCTNIQSLKARDLQELLYLSLQGVFINTFSARNQPAALTIGGGVPGEVFALPMVAGERWMIARGSYAASTPNVMVSSSPMKLQEKVVETGQSGWTSLSVGSLADEEQDKYGYAFIAAMGHYVELKVPEDESRHIDEDHVLAFPSHADFSVNNSYGNMRGFLLSGEGAVLKYTAPKGGGRIMVQLRSLKKEAALMIKVGDLDLACPSKDSSLLQKTSNSGRNSLKSFGKAEMRIAQAHVIKEMQPDTLDGKELEKDIPAMDEKVKICDKDATNDLGEKCCEEANIGSKSTKCEAEDCVCMGADHKGLRGKGEVNDVLVEEKPKPTPKIRLKRKLGLILQDMALEFWGKGDEPLEECECISIAKDEEEETDEDKEDKQGLCLKQQEDERPENNLCFRLHRGEVEVILKHHRAAIAAEPGSAIFFTRPKDKGITTALSPQNNGMYQQDYKYQAGDLLVQNVFELRHDSEWKQNAGISFGTTLGGDVMAVPMFPGDVYYVRRGSYICGTANVEVRFVKSFQETLKSEEGDVFMLAVTLVPFPEETEIVSGIFFVGVAAQVRLHRASEEQQLTVDSGMFALGQAVSGRSTSRAPEFTKEWLGRGERTAPWEKRMLHGESMMMKFTHIPASANEETEARDRIVFTQSINFGSYARKLIANMQGCPCSDWEDEALVGRSLLQVDEVTAVLVPNSSETNSQSLNDAQESELSDLKQAGVSDDDTAKGNVLDTGAKQKAIVSDADIDGDNNVDPDAQKAIEQDTKGPIFDINDAETNADATLKELQQDETLVDEPSRATIKAAGSSISPGERYAMNASTRIYKLGNGAKAIELGLLYGAVALMVTAPPPTDGDHVILNGVGGSTVSYFAVDMTVHPLDPEESKVEQQLLSSSDNTWQSFRSNAAVQTEGQIILTQTGAEDIMKLHIDETEAAWKVKTGHVLATSDKVKLGAEKCVDESENKTGVNDENGFIMMVLHHEETDLEERAGWVWGYGHLRHHKLGDKETLVLDEGHLVAMKRPLSYYVSTATGQFASYLGGDSLVFHFTGPGELVSQSKNIRHYAQHLCTSALGL